MNCLDCQKFKGLQEEVAFLKYQLARRNKQLLDIPRKQSENTHSILQKLLNEMKEQEEQLKVNRMCDDLYKEEVENERN